LVDIGDEDWEVEEQTIKNGGKGELVVSNWVILSVRVGYKFCARVLSVSVPGMSVTENCVRTSLRHHTSELEGDIFEVST
jgi:hypothetical protein